MFMKASNGFPPNFTKIELKTGGLKELEKAFQVCVLLFNQANEYQLTAKLYDSLGYKGQAKRYAHKAEAFNESAYIVRSCLGISFSDVIEAVSAEACTENKES